MKKKQFYRFILKSPKGYGVLFAPEGMRHGFGTEVKPVENWETIVFELRGGMYRPFMNSDVGARFANEELKNMLQENLPADYPLEFYPIRIKSDTYGDTIYYLIHFKIIFDVIDEKNSVWVTGSIAKPWIDYEKAKELDFFNASSAINEIMVSDKIKRLMCKNKLDIGIEFIKVPYVE